MPEINADRKEYLRYLANLRTRVTSSAAAQVTFFNYHAPHPDDLLSIIGTIQLFNEPTIMATSQAWMGKDYTPMMMAYNTMMTSPGDPHGASTISIVMALIAGLLAAVYAIVQRKTARS